MHDMVRCACFVLVVWSLAAVVNAAPNTVSATYDIHYNGIPVAVLTEHFEAKDGAYRVTSNSNPMGIFALVQKLAVRLMSRGAVSGDGLRPQRFEGRRGASDEIEIAADFDWSARRLTIMHDGKTESLPLPRRAQDRLSVMYQFMYLAPQSGQVAVAVTNGRSLDRYSYDVTAGVEQDTVLGRLRTVHLVKQHAPGESENEIWLAPEHGYVPVRMIIVERDGTRYEQLLTKLDLRS